jgi:GAF domain-containing protein/sugar diacid utilization regulator
MDGRVFLELLARDAMPVDYEDVVARARAGGLDPTSLAELERDKVLAMRVRSALERRRRREAELSALFEIASDLAALSDRNAILALIVHRARQLLASDVAYLSLNQPDGNHTLMEVTDGIVSAAFRELRIPIGAGLGGLVARTAVPSFTSDYLVDQRFDHTGEIDASVTEEGLVAILGVPLLLGTSVIGVLYAANRNHREFAREEVDLLASLAAHAAIAIDSARLLDEMRHTLQDLHLANEQIRAHSASVERAADAHDRFTEVMLRGGTVDDVAVALIDVIGGAVLILDDNGRQLASVGAVPKGLAGRVPETGLPGRAVAAGDLWVCAIAASTERLGTLVVAGCPDLDAADLRIVERAALVTALLLIFRRTLADAENRAHAELVRDLVTLADHDPAAHDSSGLRERARLINVDLNREFTVLVARTDPDHRAQLDAAAARLTGGRSGMAGAHGAGSVLLLPGDDPSRDARDASRRLAEACGAPVTVGAAGPALLARIPEAFEEAARCTDLLIALGRRGEGAAAADLGFLTLVVGEHADIDGFLARTIGPVVDYDARRGSDLLGTVAAYFDCQGSPTATARRLSLHLNTVTQRLARVSSMLGEDWREPRRALEVQLALLLQRVRQAKVPPRAR